MEEDGGPQQVKIFIPGLDEEEEEEVVEEEEEEEEDSDVLLIISHLICSQCPMSAAPAPDSRS